MFWVKNDSKTEWYSFKVGHDNGVITKYRSYQLTGKYSLGLFDSFFRELLLPFKTGNFEHMKAS